MDSEMLKHGDPQTFSRVCFDGLEAYADAFAVREDRIAFLSLFGSRVSVRALWSALLNGSGVFLDDKPFCLEGMDSWQVFQRILPSGALHAVLCSGLVDLARIQNEFVVLGGTQEQVAERFYLYLDRVSEIPVSPEWSGWIFAEAIRTGQAVWLRTLHLSAVMYRHDEPWLESLITGFLARKGRIEV